MMVCKVSLFFQVRRSFELSHENALYWKNKNIHSLLDSSVADDADESSSNDATSPQSLPPPSHKLSKVSFLFFFSDLFIL
jgi:hypothetical protein